MKKSNHKKYIPQEEMVSPLNEELKKLYGDDLWDTNTDPYTVGGGKDCMIRYFFIIPLNEIFQCQHNDIKVADRYFISNVTKPDEREIDSFLKKK